ncbi:outer membrane beta-barrel protein [Pedobacter sp. JCM 36344]|uniref:outer membrane beta-barrel protein n=1 Tax=Pedobacter sp. JCM 36344 TaxID=3374280 RepID=UPI00397D9EC3
MNYFSSILRSGIVLMLLVFFASNLFGQNPPKSATPAPALPTREISGIVKDSTDLGVIGATVTLTSDKDTLKTSTNNDGIFIFKNVKSATYTILITSIGYTNSKPMRFKQNDMTPRIVMDPIFLKDESNTLNTVVINGTPSITYKTDTVEYKASDYVVRKNATVDELLKKMEGMEVGTDGSLIHQGQAVTKAKLNGKEFIGGDLANAIKNLPAEIVDKIQMVDDYGDQAARTGIKDGDPERILNITTRVDKSVGNQLNLSGAAGNNDRYEGDLFANRINQNQTIGLRGDFRNTVNGVAGGNGGGSATGGTTAAGSGSVSVRDKIGKKIEYNFNYRIGGNNVNSLSETESLSFARISTSTYDVFTTSASNSNNDARNHQLRLELEVPLDSLNFLRVVPSFQYNSTSSLSNSSSLQRSSFQPLNQNRTTDNNNKNTNPELGGSVFFQHSFKANRRRNFSVQAELNTNDYSAEQSQIQNTDYLDLSGNNTGNQYTNRLIVRKNLRDNYRGSATYVEPLSLNTQLEFNAQLNYNGYDNSATTRNITPTGLSSTIDSLSNIFKYSFTQGRVALNFRYGMSNMSKVRFSAGITGIPAQLSGTKLSLGTTIDRKSFNVIPIARFEYLWSRQHRISFNYNGNANEPTFDQIQPVRDVSNPNNPVVGNPNLLATFTHSLRTDYNNYIANSKLNYSVRINANFTDNAVIRNNVLIPDFAVTPAQGQSRPLITETRFVNVNGVYRINGDYSISKQLNNRKYNLTFRGNANYDHRISMLRGDLNVNTVKTFYERFGPRINPTEWFEVVPTVSYRHETSVNSLAELRGNEINTLALNLEGRIYFLQSFIFGYDASKNYVSGINSNISRNPFIINMNVEKEFFERRGKVSLQVFDALNQNNFISRDQNSDGGYVDTKSNALSRYFLVRLSMRLQKWSGAKGRNGGDVRRRGDGSFL